MKKIYAFLLAAMLAVGMTACGNTPAKAEPEEEVVVVEESDDESQQEANVETSGPILTYNDPEGYERVEIAGYPLYQYQEGDDSRMISVMVMDDTDMDELADVIAAAEAQDEAALRQALETEEGEGTLAFETLNGYNSIRSELVNEEAGQILVDYILLSADHVVFISGSTTEADAGILDSDMLGIINSISAQSAPEGEEEGTEEAPTEESAAEESEDNDEAVAEEGGEATADNSSEEEDGEVAA